MQIDPWTILFIVGMGSLLIERIFYYRSKYKNKKNNKPENPGHGERIVALETEVKNLKSENKEDHELIRKDIAKLFTLFNNLKNGVKK